MGSFFLFMAVTHLTTRRQHRLCYNSHCATEKSGGKRRVHNVLAEFLRFNEDVEVGFFELLSEHAEDITGGRKISQVVNYQVEQQL